MQDTKTALKVKCQANLSTFMFKWMNMSIIYIVTFIGLMCQLAKIINVASQMLYSLYCSVLHIE